MELTLEDEESADSKSSRCLIAELPDDIIKDIIVKGSI